jgi:N-carbamoyl-L-amino-acid hydrolase
MWDDLGDVGRAPSGGYRRFAWTAEDGALREWFRGEAARRSMTVVADRAGNLWAWDGDPDADGPGLVLGSHLDSVPDGGAFDGPLGIVSAFAAVDLLRSDGHRLDRPLGIACFADEEGARFGVACAGSKLHTGDLYADRARALSVADGTTLAEAKAAAAGGDAGPAPVLDTGAGHDAGILAAAGVPAAMLFVRNPTGISHSPAEHAEVDDCLAGVDALARVVRELA